jgi:hypothetical protein
MGNGGDTSIMKKHTLVKFFMAACLAGLMGQVAAFGQTTVSSWNITAVTELKAGKTQDLSTNSATATFLSDGTFTLLAGTNTFGGTYTNTTKALTVTFSAGSVIGLDSNVVDFIHSNVGAEVVVSIKSSKFSKIKLSKTGIPVSVSDKISGKGSITVSGKTKSKGFSFTTLWTEWVLSSGTAF